MSSKELILHPSGTSVVSSMECDITPQWIECSVLRGVILHPQWTECSVLHGV